MLLRLFVFFLLFLNRFLKEFTPFNTVTERVQDSSSAHKSVTTKLATIQNYYKFIGKGTYGNIYGNNDYVLRHAYYSAGKVSDASCHMAVKEKMVKEYPFEQGLLSPIAIYKLVNKDSPSFHSFELYVRLPETLHSHFERYGLPDEDIQRRRLWGVFMTQGIRALQYLHQTYRCVHGDISNSNLYICKGLLMIGDWDLLFPVGSQINHLLGFDSSTQLPVPVISYIISQYCFINSYDIDIWALAVTLAHTLWPNTHFLDKIEALRLPGDSCENPERCKTIYPRHENECTATARRLQHCMLNDMKSATIVFRIMNTYCHPKLKPCHKNNISHSLNIALEAGKVVQWATNENETTITFQLGKDLHTIKSNSGNKWEFV